MSPDADLNLNQEAVHQLLVTPNCYGLAWKAGRPLLRQPSKLRGNYCLQKQEVHANTSSIAAVASSCPWALHTSSTLTVTSQI